MTRIDKTRIVTHTNLLVILVFMLKINHIKTIPIGRIISLDHISDTIHFLVMFSVYASVFLLNLLESF